ncbi:hypothetical protein J21TS3_19950 [Paenibacillus cookii]|uniref:Uncharacterized protein n=1 Tax=Paenibacillus cookii TaxID=157839 RepID=A0ABQ4LV96_9BACL|nr:hypothetical protein J21TS3_19950 [Paenibacillus cookii]
MKETNYTEPEQFIVRLASLGAVWQQGVIPQVQTTRWTGGYDSLGFLSFPLSTFIFRFETLNFPSL